MYFYYLCFNNHAYTSLNTVNPLYSGHCRDLELVSSLVSVCNKGRFISVKHLLSVFTWDLATNCCSYYWDVCYSKVSSRRELTVITEDLLSIMQKVCLGSKL